MGMKIAISREGYYRCLDFAEFIQAFSYKLKAILIYLVSGSKFLIIINYYIYDEKARV